jgi:hypothetical protein
MTFLKDSAQGLLAGVMVFVLAMSVLGFAQAPKAQREFATPQAAVDAFVAAANDDDVPTLVAILGPGSDDLITTGDPVQDRNRATAFIAKLKQKESVELSKDKKTATLFIGNEEWPVPIPIVKRSGKWYFDTKAGREAILLRRIGTNELDAMAILRGYVDAQHEYAMALHDGATVNQYAQKVISTPGKHDGLVWREPDGSLGGPISEEIVKAIAEGYTTKGQPYHGYYFKILKGQGPAAPLGELNFVIKDMMIGGFAMVATPADYRVTGVKTFIISHQGIVYEKDLGPDGLQTFQHMNLYDPDKTWAKTNDSWIENQGGPATESASEKPE